METQDSAIDFASSAIFSFHLISESSVKLKNVACTVPGHTRIASRCSSDWPILYFKNAPRDMATAFEGLSVFILQRSRRKGPGPCVTQWSNQGLIRRHT